MARDDAVLIIPADGDAVRRSLDVHRAIGGQRSVQDDRGAVQVGGEADHAAAVLNLIRGPPDGADFRSTARIRDRDVDPLACGFAGHRRLGAGWDPWCNGFVGAGAERDETQEAAREPEAAGPHTE